MAQDTKHVADLIAERDRLAAELRTNHADRVKIQHRLDSTRANRDLSRARRRCASANAALSNGSALSTIRCLAASMPRWTNDSSMAVRRLRKVSECRLAIWL
jgi:hypothetical protein